VDINIATLAGHLAFGLIAFSFLVKDILWLRLLSILASLFSVFYNYFIPANPMWLAINWNIIFVLVNVYHVAVIIYEKRSVDMSPKFKELYETMFKELTPVEFLKITNVAKWIKYETPEPIIKQNKPVNDLILIYNGTVDVIVDRKKVAELKDGQFVGEMIYHRKTSNSYVCSKTQYGVLSVATRKIQGFIKT